MNITEIIFRKTFDSGKLRAVVSITIDDCFAIHEIKLIQTDHLFIAMPCRTDSYGISRDIAHPNVTNLKAQSLVHTRIMWQLTNLPKLRISRHKIHKLRQIVGAFYFFLYTLCVLTILIR